MDLALLQTDPQQKPKASLTEEEEEIARLMVYGLPEAETILGKEIKPHWPLTLDQAAKFMGYRLKRARTHLDPNPEFRGLAGKLLKERREAERTRNLQTLIDIRDDPGEGFAADRTVRIKAVQAIEGNEGKQSVNVTVNTQTNVGAVSPGYVIRLPARTNTDAIAHDAGLTLEHSSLDRSQHVMIEEAE